MHFFSEILSKKYMFFAHFLRYFQPIQNNYHREIGMFFLFLERINTSYTKVCCSLQIENTEYTRASYISNKINHLFFAWFSARQALWDKGCSSLGMHEALVSNTCSSISSFIYNLND